VRPPGLVTAANIGKLTDDELHAYHLECSDGSGGSNLAKKEIGLRESRKIQQRWIIGTVIAVALALLGLLINKLDKFVWWVTHGFRFHE
jgi:hypothetical protein